MSKPGWRVSVQWKMAVGCVPPQVPPCLRDPPAAGLAVPGNAGGATQHETDPVLSLEVTARPQCGSGCTNTGWRPRHLTDTGRRPPASHRHRTAAPGISRTRFSTVSPVPQLFQTSLDPRPCSSRPATGQGSAPNHTSYSGSRFYAQPKASALQLILLVKPELGPMSLLSVV